MKNKYRSIHKIEELANLMSRISEDEWCAGWLMGLEFTLWDRINKVEWLNPHANVSSHDYRKLKALSKELRGWIIWSDKDAECFVTLVQWKKILEKKQNEFP